MAVEFGVLGEVEIWVDGRPVAVRGARQQAILAVLLVEANRPVTNDQILDRAWGTGRLPDRPANAVQTQLTLLRRLLRPADNGATVVWQQAGYRFTVDEQAVDLHRFHTLISDARTADDERATTLLEQALALWRGEPFASLNLPWFSTLRGTLTRERHAAQLDLTDARLRRGQHAELIAGLTDLADRHPLDERLGAQLILALYRSGRPADALEHYHRIRRQLADDLGIDPSAALQELHQQILAADPLLTSAAATTGTGAVSLPTPHQLPAAPRLFTGRAKELATLDSALDAALGRAETMIAAIVGAGGIGKTWLALHWAHQHLDLFPDGQLYVDLRGYSPDAAPMGSDAAVRAFLGALGADPKLIPADLPAQAALFRSLVAGKRMLILLDNAVNTTQITPLLCGGPSCAVLVTSRDHLTGLITSTGAHHLVLDALTDAEARALLTEQLGARRVGAESTAMTELLAYCGGYPLALSIVAGHAVTHPQTPLTALVDDLPNARPGTVDSGGSNGSMPTVFSWSYAALTAEQADLFTLLGLAPGPDISSAAAASLAGVSSAEVQVLLRGLERASLVHQQRTGRWRMHDLIRQYAAAAAHQDRTDADRTAALRRSIDFYLHTAHAADQLLFLAQPRIELRPPVSGCLPGPLPDWSAALDWFDAEHACLLAAQQLAARNAWHEAVWQLGWVLSSFHFRRGHLRDDLDVARAALAATYHLGDLSAQGLAHRHVGAAHARVGRNDEALTELHHALTLAEHTDNPVHQADAHGLFAAVYERQGEYQRALAHATEALRLFRTIHNPPWEVAALNAVGWYSALLGDYDNARNYCEAALDLARQVHVHTIDATILDSLGYIAQQTQQPAVAIDYYQQGIDLSRRRGDVYQTANTLAKLGYPLVDLGHQDKACRAWREALELYQAQRRTAEADQMQLRLDSLEAIA